MPKLKTHKGAAKRFRTTATGKVKRVRVPHPDEEDGQAEALARHRRARLRVGRGAYRAHAALRAEVEGWFIVH